MNTKASDAFSTKSYLQRGQLKLRRAFKTIKKDDRTQGGRKGGFEKNEVGF